MPSTTLRFGEDHLGGIPWEVPRCLCHLNRRRKEDGIPWTKNHGEGVSALRIKFVGSLSKWPFSWLMNGVTKHLLYNWDGECGSVILVHSVHCIRKFTSEMLQGKGRVSLGCILRWGRSWNFMAGTPPNLPTLFPRALFLGGSLSWCHWELSPKKKASLCWNFPEKILSFDKSQVSHFSYQRSQSLQEWVLVKPPLFFRSCYMGRQFIKKIFFLCLYLDLLDM